MNVSKAGEFVGVSFIATATTECFCCYNRLSFLHVWSMFALCYEKLKQKKEASNLVVVTLSDSLLHWSALLLQCLLYSLE